MSSEALAVETLKAVFAGHLGNLVTSYLQRSNRSIDESEDKIITDLRDHMNTTFNKCSLVKTILQTNHSSQPSSTLDIYVDQRFKVDGSVIDQYSLVEIIRKGSSTIITGAGGGGKSMFMRYLWLSFFEHSAGTIPVFIELRNLNNLTHDVFEDFIYHSIIRTGSSIRQSAFKSALRNGEFVLFLDGFDEINFEKRELIQRNIIELQEKYRKLTIVVTSRPDERFIGWNGFTVGTVEELEKDKSKELIERADFDADLKRKFLAKFDELYPAHRSFLSNPLLAYMMLLSFSYNPDIPKKMVSFYEQSFDALYHRHDLTKAYQRQFHCSIDKYDFMRLTSYLCLKTYYDQKVEFTKTEILDYIRQVKSIERIDVKEEDFLNDLAMSVCILQLEGLTYTFTHRSFQEYFAAFCISRVASRDIEKLFKRFSLRFTDNVLPMVAEINPDLFREKYIIPNAKKFKSFIDRKTERGLFESFSARIGAHFRIMPKPFYQKKGGKRSRRKTYYHVAFFVGGDMDTFYRTVDSVARSQGFKKLPDASPKAREKFDLKFGSLVSDLANENTEAIIVKVINRKIFFFSAEGDSLISLPEEANNALRNFYTQTNFYRDVINEAKLFINFIKSEREKYQHVSGAFTDFFE